ncbi:unnamed protein product [Effrenium voratum]|uniref:Uncharacterized protein n=1 Tax=Effrenium voratum TaxID=2562239 RepID=A0AA36MML9_9DINO|nr:unnamed protein product [Effrenium voratum]
MRAGGRNVTSFAYDLHRSVPADRWCVTYWDLVFLGQEVSSALGRGEIQPGPEDDTSRAYGPSIYTVNEQYIKPVTKEEGIFEFLAKVQHSWPWGLRTAWCCMLANPQNLDISFFLQSPKTSPFAIALQASEVMLVVPNRHQSVYARLWCAYEAYLAQEEGKTILIAHSSNLHQVVRALRWMALAAILGAAVGTCVANHATFSISNLAHLLVGTSLVIHNDAFRRVLHLLGAMMCWVHVVRVATHRSVHLFGVDEGPHALPSHVSRMLCACYWLMTSGTFCVMEVDRVNAKSAVSEAKDLRRNYQGSVQYATCSQEADIVSIRREIGHNVHRVDHAIHVLLTAGMSTPALRDIARSVDIEHAAFAELAGAAFLLGPFELVSVVLTFADLVHSRCIWGHVFLAGVSLLSRLMLFVWLARSHWDEQRFILKVMNKYLFVSILVWLGLMLSVRIGGLSMTSLYFLWLLTTDLCLLFMLSIALLGVRGLARLPCGWRVLQILFSRGDYARNALKACACNSCDSERELSDADRSSTGSSGSGWFSRSGSGL